MLLKAGAAADTEVASEAMLSACCAGHRGIVQLLLHAGGSVFKQDRSHGRSALHLASIHGHASVVKTLLAAGAPINAADPGGSSEICPEAPSGSLRRSSGAVNPWLACKPRPQLALTAGAGAAGAGANPPPKSAIAGFVPHPPGG